MTIDPTFEDSIIRWSARSGILSRRFDNRARVPRQWSRAQVGYQLVGTWSAAILGNDTSSETYERFFELYDSGSAVARIVKTIEKEMRDSLALDEDRNNVTLALALALWECKALDATRLAQVGALVESKRMLPLLEAGKATAFQACEARFVAAQVLYAAGQHDRARQLAALSRDAYLSRSHQPGAYFTEHAHEIDGWLASHD